MCKCPIILLFHKKQGEQKNISDPIDDLVDGPIIGEVTCYHNCIPYCFISYKSSITTTFTCNENKGWRTINRL
jgi:hypothetical protein